MYSICVVILKCCWKWIFKIAYILYTLYTYSLVVHIHLFNVVLEFDKLIFWNIQGNGHAFVTQHTFLRNSFLVPVIDVMLLFSIVLDNCLVCRSALLPIQFTCCNDISRSGPVFKKLFFLPEAISNGLFCLYICFFVIYYSLRAIWRLSILRFLYLVSPTKHHTMLFCH